MKAIVKKEAKAGLCLEEMSVPKLKDDEVLIKIEKTSICGTDVHLYMWDEWAQKTLPVPSIIGHEFVGKIVEVGKCVKNFQIGERVSGEGHITCGNCRHCNAGNRVLCPKTVGVGVNRDGCFAEYLAIPQENVYRMPKEIPDDIACIFDPLGNAVHTALFSDLVGKNVLITGAGPIGLMAIPVAKKAGAHHVVISDLNPYRLEIAKKMGATRAVNIQNESIKSVMNELEIDEGFDVCLEMSGSEKAFASLSDLCVHGGHIALLGILPSNALIDWHQIIFKMITIKGIYGREIFRTWHQVAALLQSGMDISAVVTHHFPYYEFQKGFDAMLSGTSGKVILDWTV